jgi:hypothetical protein
MRNYWLKIFLGAFAIFAVGMIGVTLVRSGIAKVNSVVEGEEPIEVPLGLFPFYLGGERLGKLDHLLVLRDGPRQVESVELTVELDDSLVAQGLSGCLLAANFEHRPDQPGVNIRAGQNAEGAFSCLRDSVPMNLVEFGEAVFEPGEVRVPLYLHRDLVDELQTGFGQETAAGLSPEEVDSIAESARREVDSALSDAGLERRQGQVARRLGDSLRAAARSRIDSLRRAGPEMADTAP